MSVVRRFDRAPLQRPVRTDSGFLRADAYLTRSGVFEYRRPDGSIRRELRAPEEVFAEDSLDTLRAAPLTLEHPDVAVTPANVRELAVGTVGTDVRRDGEFVRGTVMVTAADAIAAVDAGRMQELSCGYDCVLIEEPGEWQGERYDCRQTQVKYNHLALVPEGRAGPEVRLHLDAADAVMVANTGGGGPSGGRQMATRRIKLGRSRFDVDEQVADSIEEEIAAKEAELADLKAKLEASKTDNEKLQAEKDALEEAKAKEDEEKAKEDKEAEEKQDAAIREAVKARVALERQAAPILGAEVKLDEMDNLAIKRAVIAKLSPSAKLDDKGEVYVQARYDAALEAQGSQPNAALGQLRQTMDAAGAGGATVEQRRDAMIAKNRDKWKQPLTGGKGA